MGEDVGTPNPRKNSEVSTDTDSNAYHLGLGPMKVFIWQGAQILERVGNRKASE